MNKNNLPNNLYELRKAAGLSQEEFAEKLYVSRQAVSKWERGEAYPDTDNLIVISEIFSVSIDDLLRKEHIYPTVEEDAEDMPTDNASTDADVESDEEPEKKHGFGFSLDIGKVISVRAGNLNADINTDCEDGEDDDDADCEDNKKSGKLSLFFALPYPIVVAGAFLLLGFLADAWYWAWTLFITIPVYYSLIEAIFHKRPSEFSMPVFLAFIYCLLGVLYNIWHPAWIIFIIIPIYYPIVEAIERNHSDK